MTSSTARGRLPGNLHRDIMRSALRSNPMPTVYWAEVPCRDPTTEQNNIPMAIPFLPLHEMLYYFLVTANRMSLEAVTSLPNLSGQSTSFEKFCRSSRIGPKKTVPIGLHGDGVPFSKKKTVEVWSWKFMAIPWGRANLFYLH